VVAINRFHTDTDAELDFIAKTCEELGATCALSEVFAKGGEGGLDLAEKVLAAADSGKSNFAPLYSLDGSLAEKIECIAKNIYGADGVDFAPAAKKSISEIEALGYRDVPVCIAKTQYSLSDDPKKLGRPKNFTLSIRDVAISAGAGFAVAYAGDIMTMPGLPKRPAAEGIDVSEDGAILGLF